LRQADPDLLELRFEEMEVVEQPLGGRQDGLRALDVRPECPIGAAEEPDAVVETGEESTGTAPGRPGRRQACRQRFGERFETFDAEELVAARTPVPGW
jgi:hypothetical protein